MTADVLLLSPPGKGSSRYDRCTGCTTLFLSRPLSVQGVSLEGAVGGEAP